MPRKNRKSTRPRSNSQASFNALVNHEGTQQPHMPTPCWLWTGKTQRRYGIYWFYNRPNRAHRLAWEFHYGVRLSHAEWVLHRCDTPLCVRPDHLFLGDHATNMADMVSKGRSLAGARHNSATKPWVVPRGADHPVHKNPLLVTGERNPSAKLSEGDVRTIREHLACGMNYGEISRLYGVHRSTIYLIAKRKKWKHVL